MSLVLEQRMEQQTLIIDDYELAQIRHELEKSIFNDNQAEKLRHKYQKYLYDVEQGLKRGDVTKDEYLTAACFYLFPVTQLDLQFQEEKKRFLKTLKNSYGMQPSILLTFSGDPEEDALPINVPRAELSEQHLIITAKDRMQHRLEQLATEALNKLEYAISKDPEGIKSRYADAFGLVKVTPAYFDIKNDKLERRYEKMAQGMDFNITAPYELE